MSREIYDKYTDIILKIRELAADKNWQGKDPKVTASYRRVETNEVIIPIDSYLAWNETFKCCDQLIEALKIHLKFALLRHDVKFKVIFYVGDKPYYNSILN